MSLTLIGQKKGMTQVFDQDGKLVVCTVILAEPNTVLQIKRKETHGYDSIQLAGIPMTESRAKKMAKPEGGHFAKANVKPCRVLRESRVDDVEKYQVGQLVDANVFADAKFLDVE